MAPTGAKMDIKAAAAAAARGPRRNWRAHFRLAGHVDALASCSCCDVWPRHGPALATVPGLGSSLGGQIRNADDIGTIRLNERLQESQARRMRSVMLSPLPLCRLPVCGGARCGTQVVAARRGAGSTLWWSGHASGRRNWRSSPRDTFGQANASASFAQRSPLGA